MVLSPVSLDMLMRYTWRGNIRELKSVIERGVILNDGPTLLPEHLPLGIQTAATYISHSASELATVEKKHITQILHFTHGNKAETARLLGWPQYALSKIEQFQLTPYQNGN